MRSSLGKNCKNCGSDDWYHYEEHSNTACAPCVLRRQKERKPWRGRKRNKKLLSANQMRHKYGIEPEEYERLLEEQDGVCAICGSEDNGFNQHGTKRFAIDHNHTTGDIRGLLCNRCNTAIGLLQDDPDIIRKAEAYVREK